MGIVLKNNSHTVLSASMSSLDTTIYVNDTSSFPALDVGEYFYCTIGSTSGTYEIVKVTQVNSESFNVVRAQENTIAVPFNIDARVEMRVTVQSLADYVSQHGGGGGGGSGDMLAANNLSELTNIATARTNLGLGTLAVQDANSTTITGGTVSANVSASTVTATTGTASRTLAARFDDAKYFEDFNVVGDGVTDDTTNLQAAFDWCGGAVGRGLLGIPGKTYCYTNIKQPYVANTNTPNGVGCLVGKFTFKRIAGGDTAYGLAPERWLSTSPNKAFATSPFEYSNVIFDANGQCNRNVIVRGWRTRFYDCEWKGALVDELVYTKQAQDTTACTSYLIEGGVYDGRIVASGSGSAFLTEGTVADPYDAPTDCDFVDNIIDCTSTAPYAINLVNGGGWHVDFNHTYSATTQSFKCGRLAKIASLAENDFEDAVLISQFSDDNTPTIIGRNMYRSSLTVTGADDTTSETLIVDGGFLTSTSTGLVFDTTHSQKTVRLINVVSKAVEGTSFVKSNAGAIYAINCNDASGNYDLRAWDDSATEGPYFDMERYSASPAVNDAITALRWVGRDSANNRQEYATIRAIIDSATSTSEQAHLEFGQVFGGSRNTIFRTTGASVAPGADGGSALGTVNLGWSGLFLGSGATVNIANSNWVATHTSGILTVGTGDLRITTAGTNAASVATVGGTQTLTNKILTAPTITTSIKPTTDDGAPLGDTTHNFSDLFLASGGVINWNNSDVTLTHAADLLTAAGATTYDFEQSGAVVNLDLYRTDTHGSAYTNHLRYLGKDSGGNKTLYGRVSLFVTDDTDGSEDSQLTFGVTTAGTFAEKVSLLGAALFPNANDGCALGFSTLGWSDLFLASGAVLNIANGNWAATHTSGVLTVGTGDLRVTTAGTNTASVVTIGGTQTLANKTFTAPVLGAATATSIVASGLLQAGTTLGISTDTLLSRPAAATWQLGAADAASPVAQTLQVQSVVAGTSNTAGADWSTIQSLSTGTGTAGLAKRSAGFKLAATGGNTVTMTIATPCVVSLASHGYVTGTPIVFTTSGALPTGIVSGTTYYVVAISASTGTFNVATSIANAIAGTLIATSGTQSGTHTGTTSATVQNPAVTTATWGPSGVTGSQITPVLDIKQTWNTSGIATALRVNVIDVNSSATAIIADFQVAGTTKCTIRKDGVVALAGSLRMSGAAENLDNQSTILSWTGTGFKLGEGRFGASAVTFGVDNTSANRDVFILRDAANVLAQRNGTTAQVGRIYNTFTDASNYERGMFDWAATANWFTVGTANAGTGTARNMALVSAGGIIGIGGTTSSFPALKRSTTIIQARLADDSAYASVQAKHMTDTNATTGLTAGVLAATTNASIVLYDASGQAYRVPCII